MEKPDSDSQVENALCIDVRLLASSERWEVYLIYMQGLCIQNTLNFHTI